VPWGLQRRSLKCSSRQLANHLGRRHCLLLLCFAGSLGSLQNWGMDQEENWSGHAKLQSHATLLCSPLDHLFLSDRLSSRTLLAKSWKLVRYTAEACSIIRVVCPTRKSGDVGEAAVNLRHPAIVHASLSPLVLYLAQIGAAKASGVYLGCLFRWSGLHSNGWLGNSCWLPCFLRFGHLAAVTSGVEEGQALAALPVNSRIT
jgi:hypothetical protein